MEQQESSTLTRRRAVTVGATAAAGAVGVVSLAACGGSSSGAATTGDAGAASTPAAAGSGSGSASSAASGGNVLAKLSDVPVGGVLVVDNIVLSQPTAGQVVGFSNKCTHQGCAVAADGNGLKCPCHQSTFDASGKPTSGPAQSPLASVAVKVDGDNVVAG